MQTQMRTLYDPLSSALRCWHTDDLHQLRNTALASLEDGEDRRRIVESIDDELDRRKRTQ